MNIAYVRISSRTQSIERQEENLRPYNIEKWYTETASAKDMNRAKLQALLDFVREGDTVYIDDFSRLARNVKDLLSIVNYFEKKDVKLVSVQENLDTSTPTGRLMLTVIGSINEFQRKNTLEMQRIGIEIAKKKGKYRKKKPLRADFGRYYDKWQAGKLSVVEMTRLLGHKSRTTTYKNIKEYEEILRQKEEEQKKE